MPRKYNITKKTLKAIALSYSLDQRRKETEVNIFNGYMF